MSCCCRPAEGATARAKPLALVLDRDGLTLLSETLGVIAALSFTIVCTGNTWLDFKDWIECGLHNNFHSHMSFSFQFGLAMLTTTAVTLFAIGAVDKDGGDKAWKRFLPFVIISLVVYIGVFVLLHVKLAMMLELHFTCQKKILLQELDPVNYPPASYNTTTVAEAKVNLFPEWGFYAFCVYLVPTRYVQ